MIKFIGYRKFGAITLVVSLLSGCATQQSADDLDRYWSNENDKLVRLLGTRYFKIGPVRAHRAMLLALANLGMTIESQDSTTGFILAKAAAPRPLSDVEWARVAAAATPEAQRFMGPLVTIDANNTDVLVNAIIIPRAKDVQINIRFRTKYTGPTAGLIIGEQAPPLATKIGFPKVWDEFKRTVSAAPQIITKKSRPPQSKKKSRPPPKSGSTGSGFFVSKLGHLITNQHVVDNCKSVTVGDKAQSQIDANVLETDKRNDLALLRISSTSMASGETKTLMRKLGISVVPLASQGLLRSEGVNLGEDVLVAGYPFGDIFSNTIKVTKGIVSANRGLGNDTGQFQIDAAVQPGNSGGPIYDQKGNIIGVVVAQLNKIKVAKAIGSLPENTNFGIKASTVRQFLTSSGLPTKWSDRSTKMPTKEIAKIAKNQTVMVVCHR